MTGERASSCAGGKNLVETPDNGLPFPSVTVAVATAVWQIERDEGARAKPTFAGGPGCTSTAIKPATGLALLAEA